MSAWKWPGSRWWRFDLHAHTPVSGDYGKGPDQAALRKRTPQDWLLDYMQAGIDCVAITDHNSGAWIDKLRQALEQLRQEMPEGYRELHLLPGVEISVNGGIHLLAILPDDSMTADIDRLLGGAGYPGAPGASDTVTSKSFEEVVTEIDGVGGVAIPAHADGTNGLFKQLSGATLGQALGCVDPPAIEILDPFAEMPSLYTEQRNFWTELLGSDAHHPSGDLGQKYPGSHFTWIKMSSPSLEGLRLALHDGSLSVLRNDSRPRDPNGHGSNIIESVKVSDARYMGREKPFELKLNPWLNAIIGGRGTGKSTLVEFLRLALRRENELPEALSREYKKYTRAYSDRSDGGLLTDQTTIEVVYRKDGTRFRVQWDSAGKLDAIEEEHDGDWRRAEGDVRQRFPVRIYSQKQVFQLATTPLALLRIVDDAPGVNRTSWEEGWTQEENRFLSLRGRARAIEASLKEEQRLRGELSDVERKLEIFEHDGHADVLRTFQMRSRQVGDVEAWEAGWTAAGDRLRQLADELVPDDLDAPSFDLNAEVDAAIHQSAHAVRARIGEIRKSIRELAGRADEVLADWRQEKSDSPWQRAVTASEEAYSELRQQLAAEGVADPSAYGELVQRRRTIEQELSKLGSRKDQVKELQGQADESLERLQSLRRKLTEEREAFLKAVLEESRYVRIRVVPFGDRTNVERDFRRLLQKDTGFDRDIDELLGGPCDEGSRPAGSEVERSLAKLKERVRDLGRGGPNVESPRDRRFATHLGQLPPEAFDRLDLWFPEDSLEVQYSTTTDGKNFKSVQEGSPGQKTAALLAFLLSYGDEPLVLDQPEDDLDNHLIYELIVTQLREVKRARQLIVVSHNPNIVVNGDAELVVALNARGGETKKECKGSLQEEEVRTTICQIMEGGSEAFDQRYRRIRGDRQRRLLEGRNV